MVNKIYEPPKIDNKIVHGVHDDTPVKVFRKPMGLGCRRG